MAMTTIVVITDTVVITSLRTPQIHILVDGIQVLRMDLQSTGIGKQALQVRKSGDSPLGVVYVAIAPPGIDLEDRLGGTVPDQGVVGKPHGIACRDSVEGVRIDVDPGHVSYRCFTTPGIDGLLVGEGKPPATVKVADVAVAGITNDARAGGWWWSHHGSIRHTVSFLRQDGDHVSPGLAQAKQCCLVEDMAFAVVDIAAAPPLFHQVDSGITGCTDDRAVGVQHRSAGVDTVDPGLGHHGDVVVVESQGRTPVHHRRP
jgi:hypothetical protein